MHRYADLKKNRISRLEGNLVVSNRKQRASRIQKSKRDYPIGLWLVIVAMFSVSALYIRHQALYVEDSVFRDAYLLINEHFLSKKPLPAPGEELASETATVPEGAQTPQPQSAVPGSGSVPSPQSVGQAAAPPYPAANTEYPPPPQTVDQGNQGSYPVNPPYPTAPPLSAPPQPSGYPVPHSSPPSPPPYGGVAYQGGMPYSAPPAQAGTGTPLPVNPVQPPATGALSGNPVNPSASSSVPLKNGTFSYYHPILNSKSTKVGFFVVNQKTEFYPDQLYRSLFNNLLGFKSSNPKVKNFFDPRTRLNNAWVENDTLLLDFNSAFENSKYGYMGIEVKIQQVLWTFFNYREDQVNKISYISFLIDGKRKDTVGGDGKVLKPFYSRKDLHSVITLHP